MRVLVTIGTSMRSGRSLYIPLIGLFRRNKIQSRIRRMNNVSVFYLFPLKPSIYFVTTFVVAVFFLKSKSSWWLTNRIIFSNQHPSDKPIWGDFTFLEYGMPYFGIPWKLYASNLISKDYFNILFDHVKKPPVITGFIFLYISHRRISLGENAKEILSREIIAKETVSPSSIISHGTLGSSKYPLTPPSSSFHPLYISCSTAISRTTTGTATTFLIFFRSACTSSSSKRATRECRPCPSSSFPIFCDKRAKQSSPAKIERPWGPLPDAPGNERRREWARMIDAVCRFCLTSNISSLLFESCIVAIHHTYVPRIILPLNLCSFIR